MPQQRKTHIALIAVLFFALCGSCWVYFSNKALKSDLKTPQPLSYGIAPTIPPAEIRLQKFDSIQVDFRPPGEGMLFNEYPQRPYTVEIYWDGKIRFRNQMIPEGKEGAILPEQTAAILQTLNESNYTYITRNIQPRAECTDAEETYISATIEGVVSNTAILGCNNIKELDRIADTVQDAAKDFIKSTYVEAALQGNVDAQIRLSHYYKPQSIGRPHNSLTEAYYWASVAEKTSAVQQGKPNWQQGWIEKERKEIENSLTPEQIAEVKKRVEEWKPTP